MSLSDTFLNADSKNRGMKTKASDPPAPLTREPITPQHAKTPAWGLRDHP